MTIRRKLLSEAKSECKKILQAGHYKTNRNKYERDKAVKIYRH